MQQVYAHTPPWKDKPRPKSLMGFEPYTSGESFTSSQKQLKCWQRFIAVQTSNVSRTKGEKKN